METREAVGYIRVSTAEQATSGLGLDAQRRAIAEACKARGWPVIAVFADEGVGSMQKRPALDDAVTLCAARKGRVLVVGRLDRLARSLPAYAAVVEGARREGWQMIALDTDASTPQGEAMELVVLAFAQLERRLIGQRTREALAAARARGVRLGRPVECPLEVGAKILHARRRRRMTATAIAAWLNAEGVPSPRGSAWCVATVARVLSREGVRLRRGRPRGRI